MKRRWLALGAMVAMALQANSAFADLAPSKLVVPAASVQSDTAVANVVSLEPSWTYPSQAAIVDSAHGIRDLPAAPGSAALVLTALLSAGVWQAGRSAKNIHLGHLPDWYHSSAPDRIGHTVLFDFQFLDILPAAFQPDDGSAVQTRVPVNDMRPPIPTGFVLAVVGARPPPRA